MSKASLPREIKIKLTNYIKILLDKFSKFDSICESGTFVKNGKFINYEIIYKLEFPEVNFRKLSVKIWISNKLDVHIIAETWKNKLKIKAKGRMKTNKIKLPIPKVTLV